MISILNSVFTVVFYVKRWTKQDLTCIFFFKKINQLNLLYICIHLYLQYILNYVFTIVFYTMRWTKQDSTCIYFKEFLNQLNLLYIFIYLYLQQKELRACELMCRIMGYGHFLDLKEFLDQFNLLYI
jgi:hypothetical protein